MALMNETLKRIMRASMVPGSPRYPEVPIRILTHFYWTNGIICMRTTEVPPSYEEALAQHEHMMRQPPWFARFLLPIALPRVEVPELVRCTNCDGQGVVRITPEEAGVIGHVEPGELDEDCSGPDGEGCCAGWLCPRIPSVRLSAGGDVFHMQGLVAALLREWGVETVGLATMHGAFGRAASLVARFEGEGFEGFVAGLKEPMAATCYGTTRMWLEWKGLKNERTVQGE